MGVYTDTCLVFGALVMQDTKTIETTVTKFNEDTGEPYDRVDRHSVHRSIVKGTDIEVHAWPEEYDGFDPETDDMSAADEYINNTIVSGYDTVCFVGHIVACTDEQDMPVALGTVIDSATHIDKMRKSLEPYFSSEDIGAILERSQFHLFHKNY